MTTDLVEEKKSVLGSILLVDDEPSILKSVSYDLRKANYDTDTAASAEIAVNKFKANPYNLVITDLVMEGMSGVDLLREIKRIEPESFVILLTGFGTMNTAIEAMRLGASDLLVKPCQRSELLLRVRNCFEKIELKRKIKLYEKIIPICCVCKKIRDDSNVGPGKGPWISFEDYLISNSDLDLSHGYCDDCLPDLKG